MIGSRKVHPFDWAEWFEEHVRELLFKNDHEPLVNYQSFGNDVILSVPTPEHYLLLLYVLSFRNEKEAVSFPEKGVGGGSVSMLAVRFG